jgi:hypothetical protein
VNKRSATALLTAQRVCIATTSFSILEYCISAAYRGWMQRSLDARLNPNHAYIHLACCASQPIKQMHAVHKVEPLRADPQTCSEQHALQSKRQSMHNKAIATRSYITACEHSRCIVC